MQVLKRNPLPHSLLLWLVLLAALWACLGAQTLGLKTASGQIYGLQTASWESTPLQAAPRLGLRASASESVSAPPVGTGNVPNAQPSALAATNPLALPPHAGYTTASAFYQTAGWANPRIQSHLSGIDFSQPVEAVILPAGTTVVQYQIPGNPTGNYFAPIGTPAGAIGVDPTGRIATTFTTTGDVIVLRSTAANTSQNFNIPPLARGQGGGTQFFTTNPSAFRRNP